MISIVPRPVSLVEKPGSFALPADALQVGGASPGVVEVRIDPAALPVEGYRLSVTKAGVGIVAGGEAGAFHARTTLRHLVPAEALTLSAAGTAAARAKTWPIPCVEITDQPRFPWRGFMLDTCRHFFPVEVVKRFIDTLAFHKMNVFHWHLTEDQGWRIEIRRHPELTEIGAWRPDTMVGQLRGNGVRPERFDGLRHGGFYSQQQVREVVSYAAQRHVTVVPEIEMPGHAQAALAAHPELSCTGGPLRVSGTWGIHEEVFCAGNDAVFRLLEDVIDEVAPLFPGDFFHVGGDECRKGRWKACPKCQARIQAEGLADENALQSWFVRRIERVLAARGKRLIGWDEILEGGLAANATVMSWRGIEGGIEAARQGHDVVMSPTSYCYLDYRQEPDPTSEPPGFDALLPLEKVYSYEPVPSELTAAQAKHVLGVQGNLWTEYVPTPEHAEYMVWPRACALAEAGWSPAGARSWEDFRARLAVHLPRLDALGIRYRKLDR